MRLLFFGQVSGRNLESSNDGQSLHRKVVDVETMEEFVQFPLFPQDFPRRGCVRGCDRFFSLTWKMWREHPPIPVKSTISTTFSLFFPLFPHFIFPCFHGKRARTRVYPSFFPCFPRGWHVCVIVSHQNQFLNWTTRPCRRNIRVDPGKQNHGRQTDENRQAASSA